MKIVDVQQGSLEWMVARAGVVTASEFDNIVKSNFDPRDGQMPKTYLAQKVAEKWLGGPLPGFSSFDMEQGQFLETEARPFFTCETGLQTTSVGLITTDDGMIGCSPDALIGEESGVEIKCPAPQTHVSYLLANRLPPEYAPQVHGSMFVTGRPHWYFLSYRRNFPPMILKIERDENIMIKLRYALDSFLERYAEAYQEICDLNGGPPRRYKVSQPQPKPEAPLPFDLVP
jgi:hypothetical protein